MGEVHHVAVRLAGLGFHAAQAENHIGVAFAGQVFRRVQGFVQGDTKATLQQHRVGGLAANGFQQLEVLGVAGAHLQHHAGRTAQLLQASIDFFDVAFVGNLHGHHLDAMLARLLEHPGQAALTVALEGIGVGAGLVGAHAGANFAGVFQRLHHLLNVLGYIHRAQAGKDIQVVLAELHAVVGETALAIVIFMAAQNPVVIGNANGPFNRRQGFDFFLVQGLGIAQQVNLGQPLAGALNLVNANAHAGQVFQVMHGLAIGIAVQRRIGVKNG